MSKSETEEEPREVSTKKSPEALFLDSLLTGLRPIMNVDLGSFVIGLISRVAQEYTKQAKEPIACGKGCNHCCRYMVAVGSAEAVSIYRALSGLSAGPLEMIKNDIAKRVQQTAGMNEKQYWDATHETGCVFLNAEGECGIYPIRPRACSSLLVADVTPCQEHAGLVKQHAVPKNLSVIGYIALSRELRRRGLQTGIYEFNSALHTLFQDQTAAERWTRGEKVFSGNMNPGLDERIHLQVFA